MAKNGDLAGLLSCGVNPDFLALKKLLALSNDPSVRPYVQVRALHAAQKYRFHLEQEGKREAETAEKVTSEELEKLLLDTQKGTPAGLEWDDDLSLDLDARPITSPKSEVTPKESPIRGSLQHGRNGLRGYEAPDPFMTRSTVPERVLHLTSTHPRFRNNS